MDVRTSSRTSSYGWKGNPLGTVISVGDIAVLSGTVVVGVISVTGDIVEVDAQDTSDSVISEDIWIV